MEKEKAKEIVNMVVESGKKKAREEGWNEHAFALGYLMNFAETCLCYLSEDNYYVKLHLRQEE